MSLVEKIQNCESCALKNLMNTAPVPPEWQGQPEVMFIVDNIITESHDLEQTPIAGSTRTRFLQLVQESFYDYYITALIKCKPLALTYLTGDIKHCKNTWIQHEIDTVKPKVIIGCGSRVNKFVQCDFISMSPKKIVESKKNELVFKELLEKVKCQLTKTNTLL